MSGIAGTVFAQVPGPLALDSAWVPGLSVGDNPHERLRNQTAFDYRRIAQESGVRAIDFILVGSALHPTVNYPGLINDLRDLKLCLRETNLKVNQLEERCLKLETDKLAAATKRCGICALE